MTSPGLILCAIIAKLCSNNYACLVLSRNEMGECNISPALQHKESITKWKAN